MTADLTVIGLLMGASLPVKIVMLLLIGASIMSWSIIFTKRRLIRRTKDASDEFETAFWSGGDLNTLYQSASRTKGGSIGMASIFESGFRELQILRLGIEDDAHQGELWTLHGIAPSAEEMRHRAVEFLKLSRPEVAFSMRVDDQVIARPGNLKSLAKLA